MKVVIEGRGLTAGGGKVGMLRILPALAKHGRHQYVAYLPDLPEYAALDCPNLRVVLTPPSGNVLVREWWLNVTLRKFCRREKADALFCLGNFAPHHPPVPTVIRLQNAYYVYRDALACRGLTLRGRLIVKYGREHFRRLGENVSVIVQTEAMRQHLLRESPISPARVIVIPDRGMSFPGFPQRGANSGHDASLPFTFLCVAICSPNKNLEVLVEAAKRLRTLAPSPFHCLLTIDRNQHPIARELLANIERAGVGDLLVNAGWLSPERLCAAYASADALILPTLLESFGRPYDEAMHFGLPILTSDRDFARERCADAALYFDPLDAESVARAMVSIMEDSGLRRRLVENGRRILAQTPTWDDVAGRFVEVLERTAERSRQWAVGSRQGAEGSRREAVGSGLMTEVSSPNENRSFHAVPSEGGPENAGGQDFSDCAMAEKMAPPRPGQGSNPNHCRLPTTDCLLPSAYRFPPSPDVRTLFNHKARTWGRKYGASGKVNSRVEQFVVRLSELCRPPRKILDLGCGTGEIAAAIGQMGYQVTACDFAEEMISTARRNHLGSSVEWVCLKPDWEVLPFADGSFDGIVASSVFEYLDNVEGVAAELSRILRPGGILLLTVPNPCNFARKLEAWFQSTLLHHRLRQMFHRVPRIDSYAAYLRLSRNRFEAQRWQGVLGAAHFAPLDERDFSREAWQGQAKAPLVLLAVKKMPAREYELV